MAPSRASPRQGSSEDEAGHDEFVASLTQFAQDRGYDSSAELYEPHNIDRNPGSPLTSTHELLANTSISIDYIESSQAVEDTTPSAAKNLPGERLGLSLIWAM